MIREKMYEKVQLFKRLGYSRAKISSNLEIDPKTTAKYYAMDERQFKTYRREHMFRDKVLEDVLEPYWNIYVIHLHSYQSEKVCLTIKLSDAACPRPLERFVRQESSG